MGGQRYDKRNYERSKYPDLWGMVPDRSRIGILDAGGFAMVEAGFTRAKNAGNIIMKT